jgi:hypothetical protein
MATKRWCHKCNLTSGSNRPQTARARTRKRRAPFTLFVMFKEELDRLNNNTRKALEVREGAVTAISDEGMKYWKVTFNKAPESDYTFCAYIYEDGEVQIGAQRDGAPAKEYFWYKPYEEPDYSSIESMHAEFLSNLGLLLTHKTRIAHKKGIFSGSLEIEYESEGEWIYGGGTSYFKFGGFNPPPLNKKIMFYYSNEVYERT